MYTTNTEHIFIHNVYKLLENFGGFSPTLTPKRQSQACKKCGK